MHEPAQPRIPRARQRCAHAHPGSFGPADPDLLAREPKARLIDTREESEYAAGHILGAEWLGKGVIERDIETRHPDRDEPLYLYCGGGFRSALAADNLQKMGYHNVYSIDGGWRELKDLLTIEK